MRNVCFICGMDRLTLDTQGGGFEKHIHSEHNMWAYAFMLIHIRQKDPLQYNGWEAEVASRLAEDDFSFIPSNNAISLHEYHERKSQEANQLLDKITAMEAALAATSKQVAMLTDQMGRPDRTSDRRGSSV